MEWRTYLEWCFLWIQEIKRVLKPDGRFAINVLVDSCDRDDTRDMRSPQVEFYKIIQSSGMKIMAQPFWADATKAQNLHGGWCNPKSIYMWNPAEVIIIGCKEFYQKQSDGIATISEEDWKRGTNGIWTIFPETQGLTQANFPVDLPRLIIELLTYQDDLVLDPFMGSGTTAVAAKQINRNYIGFELSEHYTEIARLRVEGVIPGIRQDFRKKMLLKKNKGGNLIAHGL